MIYIDLDGTVLNFATAFCKWYNLPINFTWPKGEYDIAKITGKSLDCLNDPLFWVLLEPYYSAQSIIQMVQYYAKAMKTNWDFITISPNIPEVITMKKHICMHYFKNREPVVLTTPTKNIMATANDVILIDDKLDEILAWPNPNHRILVPRLWNIADGKDTDIVELGLTRIYDNLTFGEML